MISVRKPALVSSLSLSLSARGAHAKSSGLHKPRTRSLRRIHNNDVGRVREREHLFLSRYSSLHTHTHARVPNKRKKSKTKGSRRDCYLRPISLFPISCPAARFLFEHRLFFIYTALCIITPFFLTAPALLLYIRRLRALPFREQLYIHICSVCLILSYRERGRVYDCGNPIRAYKQDTYTTAALLRSERARAFVRK